MDSFESSSDVFEAYVDETIGVINLKGSVFDIATDLSLKQAFFKKIRLAYLMPNIEVLLMLSDESAMGEEKHAQFIKMIIESHDKGSDIFQEENALSQFIKLMCGFDKIIVSGVRGSVVGAFFGTILATDHRIASDSTVFSFPNVRYQMPPQGALAFYLSKHLGIGKAKQILLDGKSLTAYEAYKLGLIDKIVENNDFQQHCIEIAKTILQVSSRVVHMKKQVRRFDLEILEHYFEVDTKLATKYRIKMPSDENNE